MTQSAYSQYLAHIQSLAQHPSEAPLCKAFDQRLRLNQGPALGPEEPEYISVLVIAYDRLAKQPTAQTNMRRAAIELFRNYLRDASCSYALLDAAADLAASFELRNDPQLANSFADELMGYFDNRSDVAFEDLNRLDGRELKIAITLFDLWTTTCPIEPAQEVGQNKQKAIQALLQNTAEQVQKIYDKASPYDQLLLVVAQAAMAITPEWMGQTGYRLTQKAMQSREARTDDLPSTWEQFTEEYDMLFDIYPAWQQAFLTGQSKATNQPKKAEPKGKLFEQLVEMLPGKSA